MIGISLYNGMNSTLEENLKYMELASSYGIKKVFTSFHIPESNNNVYEEFNEILNKSKELGMELIIDISKSYMDKIDIEKYSIHALRLDFGFNIEEVANLSNTLPFKVQLNASTVSEDYLNQLIKLKANLKNMEVCHNYYPRRDTGISYELMLDRNRVFKSHGMNVMAFIPSQVGKRGPIYEGLPTIESHRDIDPIISAQHLLKGYVDEVLIGDPFASKEELERLSKIKSDIITLPIRLFGKLSSSEEEILTGIHTNRMDPGEFVIRSQEARIKKKSAIDPRNTMEREKYCVTIDNKDYLRYEGELQILKKDMKRDERINVVGDCKNAGLLIDLIKPGDSFEFTIIE
ncbi:DUF871 family protein [Alkaliphilus sp. MSJ-5]|uniref:DUF871 family protein n=1 Tax=Alkaliphilus flagellatus TaxID=2841507 RepID=A0ABS6FXB7_9FIRM|nr:MupG family TIM beta-alpha barrel fold protein [Alkaliphilus flagellatus]MBU5674886.1 DUF871 family protein [Alkaliphilus flagellatus]